MALGVAAVLSLLAATAARAADPVRVLVDDVPLALIPAPVIQDAFLFLPLRQLAQHFQASLVVDRQSIEVRRVDGSTYLLRLGRLEVWSGSVVVAVTEAPVQVMQGTTMIPRGAVDVLFETLTVWNPQDGVLTITTARRPVQITTTPRPAAPAARPGSAPGPAAVFVPEFHPAVERPIVASGYVTAGMALGAETTATARLQFRTHTGAERVDGSVAMSAGSSLLTTAGTITRRTPEDTLTLGGLSVNDSPLTVHEQALIGAVYQLRRGRVTSRVFGGNIPGTGSHLYGATVALDPTGLWLLQGATVYDPATGALVLKGRADRLLRPGLTAFTESAWGSSFAGSGSAWRLGLEFGSKPFTTSLSYLSLSPGFPTAGNATLFAGRSGPLVALSYRPSPVWAFSGSASALRGAPGVSDRYVTSLLAHYRPAPSIGIVAETRAVEDTTAGVRTRSTSAQVAVTFTTGPWGLVLAGSQTMDAGVLTGTAASTATLSFRAGYTLPSGLPVWAEVSRSSGDTAAWGYAVGSAFRLSDRIDLTTQVRHKIYTLPSTYADTSLELSVSQPLASGAHLTLGGGLRYVTTAGVATPYLAFQYGYPLYAYGPPQTGALAAVMYLDRNGNGARDDGEPGVGGIVLRVDEKRAAVSDEQGALSVSGVQAGEVVVAVDDGTVPAHLVAVAPVQTVQVVATQTREVAFALAPAAALLGVVFHDENGNGVRDEGEKVIPGVVLRLSGTEVFRTADGEGVYVFDHLPPGQYLVTIDARSVPLGFRVRGEGSYPVTAVAGEERSLDVPLDGRPIIRTF